MDTEKFQELVLQQLQALTEGQKQLTERLDSVEKGQNQISERLDSVEKGQNRLEAHLESVEKGQNRLEARLESVEKGQTRLEARMESEVIDKILALFDAREAQNERLQRVEDKLDSIEIDTSYLVARVARLEKLAK